jgi:hypothetical protein
MAELEQKNTISPQLQTDGKLEQEAKMTKSQI